MPAWGSPRLFCVQEIPAMGTYWGHEGRHETNYHRLFHLLVPKQGPADTPEGELLRVLSKVYYRVYNDGDGYSILYEFLPSGFQVPAGAPKIVHTLFDNIKRRRRGKVDEAELERVVDATVQWIASIVNTRFSPEELFLQRVRHANTATLTKLRESNNPAHRKLAEEQLNRKYAESLQYNQVPTLLEKANKTNNARHRKIIGNVLDQRYAEALKYNLQNMTPGTVQQLVREGEAATRKRTRNNANNVDGKYKRLVGNLARKELGERPGREALYQLALQYADRLGATNIRYLSNNSNKRPATPPGADTELLERMYAEVRDAGPSYRYRKNDTNLLNKLRHYGRLTRAQRAGRNKAEVNGRDRGYLIHSRVKNLIAKAAKNTDGWQHLQLAHLNAAARLIQWLTPDDVRNDVTDWVSIWHSLPSNSPLRPAVEWALRQSIKSKKPSYLSQSLVGWAAKLPANSVAGQAVDAALRHRHNSTGRISDLDVWVKLASGLPRDSIARTAAEEELVDILKRTKDVRYTGEPKPRVLWAYELGWKPVRPAVISRARALLPTSPHPEALRRQLDRFPPVQYARGRISFVFDEWNGQKRANRNAAAYNHDNMRHIFRQNNYSNSNKNSSNNNKNNSNNKNNNSNNNNNNNYNDNNNNYYARRKAIRRRHLSNNNYNNYNNNGNSNR